MPKRIANVAVLVEDAEQQNLVRRFLERSGGRQFIRGIRFVDLPAGRGSAVKYVVDKYPKEVRACRSSLGRRASALLIVMVDADTREVDFRAAELSKKLESAEMPRREDSEPIVILIPKRHVETWIRALLGNEVDETTDYTKAPYSTPTSNEITAAAGTLHAWTRPNAEPGPTCCPSLANAIPEWQRTSS